MENPARHRISASFRRFGDLPKVLLLIGKDFLLAQVSATKFTAQNILGIVIKGIRVGGQTQDFFIAQAPVSFFKLLAI
jgi:hypothetical protein